MDSLFLLFHLLKLCSLVNYPRKSSAKTKAFFGPRLYEYPRKYLLFSLNLSLCVSSILRPCVRQKYFLLSLTPSTQRAAIRYTNTVSFAPRTVNAHRNKTSMYCPSRDLWSAWSLRLDYFELKQSPKIFLPAQNLQFHLSFSSFLVFFTFASNRVNFEYRDE